MLEAFRLRVVEFLGSSVENGSACPAFGAILPPELHDMARQWQQTMATAGMAGLHWPVAYGGQGMSRDYTKLWFEECAKADVSPYINLQGIILAGEAILRAGTDAQKAEHLPGTLTGSTLWCQLFSEPGAGSDLAGLATTAIADGDRFVLNGQKVWSSNAQFAQKAILLARTAKDVPQHRGISFFLLDMTLPGIEVRPIKQMTGDHEFCEVFMADVEIPADALLGEPGDGWAVAMSVLVDERGSFGDAGVISLQRELDELSHLDLGGDAVLVDRLAGLLGKGHALTALLQRLGANPSMAPVAKLQRSEMSVETLGLEASIRGPQAMLNDESALAFLYSPGMKIAGGSSEIQRNIVGERLLGLPKEPKGPLTESPG